MPAECEAPGCSEPVQARNLCAGHYARLRRHGDIQADRPLERTRAADRKQIALRLPTSLADQLEERAAATGTNRNELIVQLLTTATQGGLA